jgi:acyl-CoA reductase-like NAD-dependent aldehyde dehydrogenase
MSIVGEKNTAPTGDKITVINPATEEVLDEVPRGNAQDIDSAVKAAVKAFQEWRFTPASDKAELLHQVASNIRAQHDELVSLLIQEEGKPIPESEEELWWTEETFDYYAELGRHDRGLVLPPGEPGQFNFTLKEPWGVVGCIVPWNFPLLLLAWKIAPALAAGNTVVVKPSELTPLTTLELARNAFSHLPDGVVNVVTGYGREAGEPLVTHPNVRMIAFTGSLATGQHIAKLTAHEMKKLHLELGGKDPMVIAPDVELDVSIRSLAYASLLNTGQVCTSTERVYVHESLFPQFTEELADFVSSLRLGNGLDENTDIGPMIRDKFRIKVEDHLSEAISDGAKVVVGGKRPREFEQGFFFQPTILINVNHEMRIMREETFGPIIPLMPYRDFDEAIRLVNDSPYGLGASLMSNDARLVKQFYEEVEAGTIWINDPLTDNFAGPFGGMKMSGLGRELGQEGFDQFRQVKHIHWDIEGGIKDYWYPY